MFFAYMIHKFSVKKVSENTNGTNLLTQLRIQMSFQQQLEDAGSRVEAIRTYDELRASALEYERTHL